MLQNRANTSKHCSTMSARVLIILFCLALAAVGLRMALAEDASASDRGDLWRVVHNLCAPMDRIAGVPLPCLKLDRDKGVAVVRAPYDVTRIIVVPTQKIAGVESPVLLRGDAPNLWSTAWSNRGAVTAAAPRPLAWNDIGMAVNSSSRRTQDQLHIHVDCVDARLKRALQARPPRRAGWFDLDLDPWADRYRAKRLDDAGLDRNIFKMVADEIPGAKTHMGDQSVAVVGYESAAGARGFVVLTSGDGGHAEELLDHECSGNRR
jgi:CDP-diacylglycerol pyrophosphatase